MASRFPNKFQISDVEVPDDLMLDIRSFLYDVFG